MTSVSRLDPKPTNFQGMLMAAKNRLHVEALESRELPSANWFSSNLPNAAIASQANADYAHHGSIDFADMVGIYATIEKSRTVSSSQLASLRALAENAEMLNTPSSVAFLEDEVIGLTPMGLNGHVGAAIRDGASKATLSTLVNDWFLGGIEPAAGVSYKPVNGTLFGANGPVFTDVQQGAVGDCWLLSSLAATSVQEPSTITNMFTFDGVKTVGGHKVGVYTVQFYSNGNPVFVTVDTELPAGGGVYDQPASGVLWVALAEKAYVEANGDGFVTTQHVGADSYAAVNEGMPQWALSAITGMSANEYSVNPSDAAAAFQAGEPVVFCTQTPSSPYIVPSHCYAMVGYDDSSSMPFQIYNPWGADSNGYARGEYNGHEVYGYFYADANFLDENYASDAFVGAHASKQTLVALPATPTIDAATTHTMETAQPLSGGVTCELTQIAETSVHGPHSHREMGRC